MKTASTELPWRLDGGIVHGDPPCQMSTSWAANLSPGNGNAFLTNRRKSRSHRVCRHHGRLNTGGRNADSVLATHSLSRINGEAVCFSTLKPVPKWFRNRLKVGLIRTQAGTRTLPFAIRVLFPPYIQPSRQPSTVLQPSEH